jgi:hypothetical protein
MSDTKAIKHPIVLSSSELRTEQILILHRVFPLDENNFNKLIKNSTGYKDWALNIFLMSVGWAFKLVSALIAFLVAYHATEANEKVPIDIEPWEVISVGLALFICVVLYILGRYIKSDRDKLIASIESHFKNL